MVYAFDIETMPIQAKIGELPEPEIKLGNLKDPVKIAEKQAEARAEQVAKMALNPLYGRIVCAVFICAESAPLRLTAGDDDEEERELIRSCFREMAGAHGGGYAGPPQLTSWNGATFDLPFLFKRALLLRIPIPKTVGSLDRWCKRYATTPHADLMQIWSGWDSRSYAKLDDVAGAVFGEHKIGIGFEEFPELVKSEEGRNRIADYCEQDTRLTLKLYHRFHGILF